MVLENHLIIDHTTSQGIMVGPPEMIPSTLGLRKTAELTYGVLRKIMIQMNLIYRVLQDNLVQMFFIIPVLTTRTVTKFSQEVLIIITLV